MKLLNSIIIVSFMLVLGACSKGKEGDPCSNAANIDDPKCQKNIGNVDNTEVNLSLKFLDSTFYSPLEKEWKEVSSGNLNGGIMGHVIPVYSSFLNLTKTEAINIIKNSKGQKDNPNSFLEVDYSTIPFIEVEAQKGVDYIYRYKKKDLNGQDIASYTGKMEISDGRAYLPLINAMFQGQFYSINDEVGQRFIHELQITAQSENIQGQIPKVIEFESFLQTPITDFYIAYSNSIKDFSLRNRFDFYYSGQDNVPNQNFSLLTLKQDTDPEVTRSDLRIMFKNRPKIVIEQEIFFENPIDLDRFKEKGEVSVVRGQNFYTKTILLNTDNFFNLKVRMNGAIQNLTDGRIFEVANVPAGVPWDLEMIMDMTTNPLYNNTQGTPMITPYKPTCGEITGNAFAPLAAKAEKQVATQSEGFLAICHPKTNQKLFLNKSETTTTQFDLADVFYDYFNYVPEDNLKNITGHFNGIRRVTFKLEGCMRVYSRSSGGSGVYELVSKKAEACLDANEQDQGLTGWVYFNASKTFTINNDLERFEGVAGLKAIIQTFGTKAVRRTPHFKFNGLVDDLDHLY